MASRLMTPPAGWPHGRVGMALSTGLNEHVSSRKLGIVHVGIK
jgi:hypothetical protein